MLDGAEIRIRPIKLSDASPLAELLVLNRDHLAPWEPERLPEWFTAMGQRDVIRRALDHHRRELGWAGAIVDQTGQLLGRVNLHNIVRGAAQSASLGYWVDAAHTGRGVATAAVAAILRVAFEELALHRVEAGTLVHNTASQRVLLHNGFTLIGVARQSIHIAGRWQDHQLYQAVNPDD